MKRHLVPVLRALGGGAFDIEKIDVGVDLGLEALAMRQPGQTLRIDNKERGAVGSRTPIVRDAVRLSYAPDAAPAEIGRAHV